MAEIKELPTRILNVLVQYGIQTIPELKEALESGDAYQWVGLGRQGRLRLQEWVKRTEYDGCSYCNALLNPSFDNGKSAPIDHEDESVYGPSIYCRQCGKQIRFPTEYKYYPD